MSEMLAWAAGFADGEGYFRSGHGQTIFELVQTDPAVLRKFRRAVGVGKVYGPYGPYGARKKFRQPHYTYRATNRDDVKLVLAWIRPWLSAYRRKQARQALAKRG